MEYIQLTLDDYIQCKAEIKENLVGVAKSFMRIGWHLTRIDDSGAYKLDGYNSIAEFAKAEYNINASSVCYFMKVYRACSIPGDSPRLQERYEGFEFTKLVELIKLPLEDQEMIKPELKREDIRELNKFNKENEHNPDALLNWQQESEDTLRKSVLEFFHERKQTLNALYESEACRENNIEEMKAIVRRGKVTFKEKSVFIILYSEKLFIKNKVESRCDVTWEEFFAVMHSIFDGAAAGGRTWENYFEPECQNNALKENDSQNEVYPEEVRAENESKNEEQKYSEKENSQKTAVEPSESEITLIKPDENQREYLNTFAKYLIRCKKKWFLQDCGNRVLNVINSPKEVKEMLGPNGRWWHFGIHGGVASIDLFDDYVQIWTEQHVCMGDFEWFYLASAIQSMWNVVAEEDAQIPGQKKIEDYPEAMPEIAPAQTTKESQTGACIHRQDFQCTLPEDAKLTAGDGMDCNKKCCWNCENHGHCGYECNSSAHRPEPEENVQDTEKAPQNSEENVQSQKETAREKEVQSTAEQMQPESYSASGKYTPLFIRDYLEEEERNLKAYRAEDGLPMVVIMKQEALVKGMQLLLKEAEGPEEEEAESEETVQPLLPLMKNNDQRKEWLRTWKDWGLWYQDEHTGVKYYKYDFDNGARLVAEVYMTQKEGNIPEFEHCYLHLIGGPEPPKGNCGIPKWNTYKTYNRYQNNETELVEFLKEIQKK